MIDRTVNFDDPDVLPRVLKYFGTLKGKQRITVRQYRARRSEQQNKFYWAVVLPLFCQGVKEQWEEILTVDEAHFFLKARFLGKAVVDRTTGETYRVPKGSSADLNTEEFCNYMNEIAKLCAEYLLIEVPTPDSFGIRAA